MDDVLYHLIGMERPLTGYMDMADARKSYRKLLVRFHTDRNREPNAKFITQAIVKAMEIFNDKVLHNQYSKYGKLGLNGHEENIQWEELMRAWKLVKETKRLDREERVRRQREREEEEKLQRKERERERAKETERVEDKSAKGTEEQVTEQANEPEKQTETEHLTENQGTHKEREKDVIIIDDESEGEQTTPRTTRMNEHANNSTNRSFKEEPPVIIHHAIRRKQVKFRLKWEDYGIFAWKGSNEVLADHYTELKKYLKQLKKRSPTRLYNIVNIDPMLAETLKNGNEASSEED